MNEKITFDDINAICQLLQWNDCYFRKIYRKEEDNQIYIFFHDAKTMTSREILRTDLNDETIKEEKRKIAELFKNAREKHLRRKKENKNYERSRSKNQ